MPASEENNDKAPLRQAAAQHADETLTRRPPAHTTRAGALAATTAPLPLRRSFKPCCLSYLNQSFNPVIASSTPC